jgi:hypothetical protein
MQPAAQASAAKSKTISSLNKVSSGALACVWMGGLLDHRSEPAAILCSAFAWARPIAGELSTIGPVQEQGNSVIADTHSAGCDCAKHTSVSFGIFDYLDVILGVHDKRR